MRVFSGPYCPDAAYAALTAAAAGLPDARVSRFAPEFADILAACDLSVSLAGYNTVHGAARRRGAGAGCALRPEPGAAAAGGAPGRSRPARALDPPELAPDRLAGRMLAALDAPKRPGGGRSGRARGTAVALAGA